jgi:hypothetical protein
VHNSMFFCFIRCIIYVRSNYAPLEIIVFVQPIPPKFLCNHCGKPIHDDNVCFFYRGRHLHPECFPNAVEKIKYEDLRGEPPSMPRSVSTTGLPAFKPVNLSPKDPPDLDGA